MILSGAGGPLITSAGEDDSPPPDPSIDTDLPDPLQ